MASLVANYGSSDSESDEETEGPNTSTGGATEEKVEEKVEEKETSGQPNFLTGEGIDSSSESDTGDGDDIKASQSKRTSGTEPLIGKLPNPLANDDGQTESVFRSSFQKAEEAKYSALEQHVKMTATQLSKTIDGKKVCWNFRKMGRCNKGHKCRYAHDNDIPAAQQKAGAINVGAVIYNPEVQNVSNEPTDDDNYMAQNKKKKRFGVTNSLQPPKKAMKTLDQQREEERPWTKS